MKSYTVTQEERDECTNTSFKSGLWFDFFPHGPLFFFFFFVFLASSFLMSVFILHVTVWSRAPSDRYLYTPLHITEPTPSVLVLSRSTLSQTVTELMSVQFVNHLQRYFPASRRCSIFPSWRSCLLLSPDAHSTFSHVSPLSILFILILHFSISALSSLWLHSERLHIRSASEYLNKRYGFIFLFLAFLIFSLLVLQTSGYCWKPRQRVSRAVLQPWLQSSSAQSHKKA